MNAKQASLLPGSSRRSPRDRRPRAGLFTAKGLVNKPEPPQQLQTASSSETEYTDAQYDGKVRAENLADYEPSELVHGIISESSSHDSSSSEETAAEEEESVAERSIVYTESDDEEEDHGGFVGCMDAFFMPRRAAAAKKSLIELNEKGEKELKFDMKLPIAMGFNNTGATAESSSSESKDSTIEDAKEKNERSSTAQSLRSVLNCRGDQDAPEPIPTTAIPQVRHQIADPPARVASEEPTEQFKSLMSLSHGSSGDDDSHSNMRADNPMLPPDPQSYYMEQQYQRQMMQGPSTMYPEMWQQHQHHQNQMYQPPVTVNNTYEMLVVNGMMPQQHIGYGAPNQYWNGGYAGMNPVAAGRAMEPPAIERLPSQIMVQNEDNTVGEDSSFLSYDVVPDPAKVARFTRGSPMHQETRKSPKNDTNILQSSKRYPMANTAFLAQKQKSLGQFPVKNVLQSHSDKKAYVNTPQTHSRIVRKHPGHYGGASSLDGRSSYTESDDDFQDSVQVLPEDLAVQSRIDDRSCSSSSSSKGKPPREQRWRQANLRRLQTKPSLSSVKPPRVPSTTVVASNSNPSFDERQTKKELLLKASSASSSDDDEESESDDDSDSSSDSSALDDGSDDSSEQSTKGNDDATVDSDQAIVDTESAEEKKNENLSPNAPETLQPVQEESSSASTANGDKDEYTAESGGGRNTCDEEEMPKENTRNDSNNSDVNSNDASEETIERPTVKSSALMFDSIYTRRQRRRDVAKLKMNKFLNTRSSTPSGKAAKDADKHCQSTNFASRSSQSSTGSRTLLKKEVSNIVNDTEARASTRNPPISASDSSFSASPQRENKKESRQNANTAVLRPVLRVPTLNSSAKQTPENCLSPSKSVTMALSPQSAASGTSGIKMSFSLKQSMTSEFHDAMSSASDVISISQDERNRGLQLQPTRTSDWHDTIQSPTAASVTTFMPEDSSRTKYAEVDKKATGGALFSPNNSKDKNNDIADLMIERGGSDPDDFFEAHMIVD